MEKDLDIMYIHNRIISGCVVVEVNNKLYIFKDPSPIEKQIVQYEYENTYTALLRDRILSSNDLELILDQKGIWTNKDEENLSKLENILKDILGDVTKYNQQKSIEYKISKMKSRKSGLLAHSAEHLALLSKYRLLLYLCTYDQFNNKIWSNIEEFNNEDESVINMLLQYIFFDERINESNIRKLARSEPWRSIWLSGCKVGNLFGKPMCEMSDLQTAVVSWSILYDNVYEHPECPPDDIINNDALLDIWLKEESEKRKNKRKESNLGSSSVGKHQEIGIIVNSPEEANRIFGLNSPSALKTIERRENFLKGKNKVRQADLPDISTDIKLRKARLETQSIKNRGQQ